MDPAASPSPRAAPLDALRLLTVVHQLGEPQAAENQTLIRGEKRLLALDHLLRHPATLAFLLVDAYQRRPELADKRAGLVRRLRWLLGAENTPPAPAFRRARSRVQAVERRLHFLELGAPWRRLDDALADLESRDLLAVERADEGSPGLAYRLRPRGADLLEQRFYPAGGVAGAYLKSCAAIREYLPDWPALDFEQRLGAIAESLETWRREEQVPRELDLVPLIFERVFREKF